MKTLALAAILITAFIMLSYSLLTYVGWKDSKEIKYFFISILYFLGAILNVTVYFYVAINGLEKL